MEKNIECRQMIFTARPGYYEWNIFCNDELLYTIEDANGQVAENLTEDATYSDLRDLAVEYVDSLYTESEKTDRTDFNSVVNALTDAWAYHFCIEKPEGEIDVMDKYEIAKAVRIEDFKNAMECMDFSPDDYTEKELAEMFDTFEDLLANDDTYNSIYSETLCYVLQGKGK